MSLTAYFVFDEPSHMLSQSLLTGMLMMIFLLQVAVLGKILRKDLETLEKFLRFKADLRTATA